MPSVKKQRAFVRDTALQREGVKIGVGCTDEDWDFEGLVSVDEVAAPRVRGMLK